MDKIVLAIDVSFQRHLLLKQLRPGTMGCLQALEAIKILIKAGGGGEDLEVLSQLVNY